MRNLSKKAALEQAISEAGVSLGIIPMDIQDSESVKKCVADMIAAEGSEAYD
jgi:hypothetical protein